MNAIERLHSLIERYDGKNERPDYNILFAYASAACVEAEKTIKMLNDNIDLAHKVLTQEANARPISHNPVTDLPFRISETITNLSWRANEAERELAELKDKS